MTVWFSNPVTVILILVLVVMIQGLQDGTLCTIQGPDEGILCPGAQPVLPFFLPPYFGSYATAGFCARPASNPNNPQDGRACPRADAERAVWLCARQTSF